MFEGISQDQLPAAMEALLFVSDDVVDTITLADMLEISAAEAEEALVELKEELARTGAGVQLKEVAGGWRLYTSPAFSDLVEKYVLSWDTRRMSAAALETLAVVAYGQPVTRAQISEIRGVNSDSALSTLVERGLVREAGTLDAPGNPVLYGTTRTFLEKFGLRSPEELPDLAQFAPDEETVRLISERLGATADNREHLSEGTHAPGAAVPAPDAPAPFGVVEKIDFDALDFDTDDE